jgi:co-chaperonin GroES (HSP10)
MINFKPLRGLVLIDREMHDEIQGGIIIPETSRWYGWRAKVVSVGDDVTNVKTGDQILFIKEFTRLPFKEDRNMALTNAENIAATIVVEDDVEKIVPTNDYVMIKPEGETVKDGVVLVKKFEGQESRTGIIFKSGDDCKEAGTFIDKRCWYPPLKAIKCVEDDKHYVLIQEQEILCVEN